MFLRSAIFTFSFQCTYLVTRIPLETPECLQFPSTTLVPWIFEKQQIPLWTMNPNHLLKNQMLVNNTKHFYSASLSCKVIKMFGN